MTQVHDLYVGEVSATVPETRRRIEFCVAMDPSGMFQLIASGSGGVFELTGINTSKIAYRLFVQSGPSGGPGHAVQPLVPIRGLRAIAPDPAGGCQSDPVRLLISISNEALEQAPAGNYRGHLEFTVAPE